MGKPPAFQFYAKDFMDATRFWDANACGLYIRCLCIQWEHGGIPSDLKTLARGVGMDTSEVKALWETVGPKFEDDGSGILKNRRLEAVRDRQREVSEKRRGAAKARWSDDANASANGHAKTMQRKEKEKEKVEEEDTGKGVRGEGAEKFEVFWDLYGKKVGRVKAEQKWHKLKPEEQEQVLEHVPAYVSSTPEVKFRKDPSTYLNGRCWEDEIINRTDERPRHQPATGVWNANR